MSMHLTDAERTRVEQYLMLVHRVMHDCVHGHDRCGLYSYDDLYQYGCIGLCNAAANYREDGQATFETYAYVLIRNEIFKRLEYATRRKHCEGSAPEVFPIELALEANSQNELEDLLTTVAGNASGVIAKGIEAICLQAHGYSCKEIGQRFGGASANNVSAWISRARKHLRQNPTIKALV